MTPTNDNNGFIVLHRSILSWEWYDDVNTTRVFIHCLLKANHTPRKWHGHLIERGQFITSLAKLAKETRLSVRELRTALNHLKMTNEVTIKPTNRFSIITIVNWDKYQGRDYEGGQQSGQQSGTQTANKGPTSGHNIRNKELKNIRREEERESSLDPEEVQTLFNKTCIFFKPCMTIGKASLPKIRALGQQYTIDEIREVFERANRSQFLQGNNDRSWKATFDWIITPENFQKIMDGNYDNSEPQKSTYQSYIHGNYDFAALEKETREKPKRQFYDFKAIDEEIRKK